MTTKTAYRVAIVIVNYRTPDLVEACLHSLQSEQTPDLNFQVFIGDASSGDGSSDKIKRFIAEQNLSWAMCYEIGQNGGFAFGNNHILQTKVLPEAGFDYIYFLNPDTYIRPKAVRALVQFLSTHPKAGVAGSRLENPDGSPRSFGFRTPTPWREFFRGARLGLLDRLFPKASITIHSLTETTQVDWVSGASFMMPIEVLNEVGLMDDGYFLYFEETDLMKRVQAKGFEIWHVAESRIVHLAGQATGVRTDEQPSEVTSIARLSPFWLQSRARFMRKHFGKSGAWLATGLFLAGDVVYRLHALLRGRSVQNPPRLWHDYLLQRRGR